MNDNAGKLNPCVVTVPFVKPGTPGRVVFLSNLIDMLEPLSNELFVITGEFPDRPNKAIQIIRIPANEKSELTILRAINYIIKQFEISYSLIKISRNVDVVIFYIGTQIDLLPALTAKLLRKRILWFVTGLASRVERKASTKLFGMGKIIFPIIFGILENINFHLADRIVLDQGDTIASLGLNKYEQKIATGCSAYIDFDLFKWKKEYADRRNLIGYVGRLSPEKGVLNFVKAIPLMLREREDLEFLIGGDGPLFDEIENELKDKGLSDRVKLTGWIPHDRLPGYLNELKLIVLPSYTEGGVPAIIKEAIACGVSILVTSAAGVNMIKDEETGFILEDNSPERIAEKVIQVLKHPDPEKILSSARKLAEEFSYEKAVAQYKAILYGETG